MQGFSVAECGTIDTANHYSFSSPYLASCKCVPPPAGKHWTEKASHMSPSWLTLPSMPVHSTGLSEKPLPLLPNQVQPLCWLTTPSNNMPGLMHYSEAHYFLSHPGGGPCVDSHCWTVCMSTAPNFDSIVLVICVVEWQICCSNSSSYWHVSVQQQQNCCC